MRSRIRPRLSLRLMLLLVSIFGIVLGFLSHRIRSQQASILQLRELSGQLESPSMDAMTWIAGMTVDSIQFLGPGIGDEAIETIGDASASLRVKRITFFETRVTQDGVHQLKAALPEVEIRLVTASPVPELGIPVESLQRR